MQKAKKPKHFIREWRLHREVKTQSALAKSVNLTSQTICRLESGEANPGLDVLERIANALNCTRGELLDVDPRNTNPLSGGRDTKASPFTGMAETPREFVGPRKRVDRHPAFGAMKGMFTIEPGYDLAQSPFSPEELAEMDANLDRTADMIEAGMKNKS